MKVFVLTNQAPDWSAPPGAPRSVHSTLEGAKRAFANGKYMDKWVESIPGRWYGPDGCGSIIQFEVEEVEEVEEEVARDPEEPVAHLAVAMDTLMQADGGAYAVEDMLLVASCALLRAQDAAGKQDDPNTQMFVNKLYDSINNLLAS